MAMMKMIVNQRKLTFVLIMLIPNFNIVKANLKVDPVNLT